MTQNGSLYVFARTHQGHLLHWRLRTVGGEQAVLDGPIDHQWHAGYDPVAVGGPGDSVFVYARGTRDQLLRWQSADDVGVGWQRVSTATVGIGEEATVSLPADRRPLRLVVREVEQLVPLNQGADAAHELADRVPFVDVVPLR